MRRRRHRAQSHRPAIRWSSPTWQVPLRHQCHFTRQVRPAVSLWLILRPRAAFGPSSPQTEQVPAALPLAGALPTVSTQSAPEGIRTPNLLIRSQMLYPLSYGRRCCVRDRRSQQRPTLPCPRPPAEISLSAHVEGPCARVVGSSRNARVGAPLRSMRDNRYVRHGGLASTTLMTAHAAMGPRTPGLQPHLPSQAADISTAGGGNRGLKGVRPRPLAQPHARPMAQPPAQPATAPGSAAGPAIPRYDVGHRKAPERPQDLGPVSAADTARVA